MPRPIPSFLAAVAACAPLAVLAHAGGDAGTHHGFATGLLHPLTGADHLLAMLAVGVWSALAQGAGAPPRAVLRAPLVFVAALLAGAVAAAAGAVLPAVEPMIAASLLALGMATALRLRLPGGVGLALVAPFALFHGAAHGSELGAGSALAGMVVASALLHLAGIACGRVLRGRSAWWSRAAGAGVGAFGLALLVA